jgi:hypothetical protein
MQIEPCLVETLVVQRCMFLCPASASHWIGESRHADLCEPRPVVLLPGRPSGDLRAGMQGGNGHGGSSGAGTDQDVMLSSDDVVSDFGLQCTGRNSLDYDMS